ncbi:MAG: TIGR03118 family protein [Bryobacteraceae bacterium]
MATFLFPIVTAAAQSGANVYVQHNLISDIPGMADLTDPNLIDPWGLSFSTTSPFWVSNHGKGNTTLYNDASSAGITITPLVVTIPTGSKGPTPSVPTGQVQNNTTGFVLANGKAASFIFATEDGTISAWNGGTEATLMVDNSPAGTVYKGLAIGNGSAGPLLYAANFSYGTIDVISTDFKLTSVSGNFADPNMPPGYAPFNIWNINGSLYVTYAVQNSTKTEDVQALGNGVVDIFDLNGNLLQRLTSGGPLDSPWGVAVAPANWGAFGGAVLVGNFGNGWINAFDPKTGTLLGALQDSTGTPIAIQGLWAIEFGNGSSGGDKQYLYFTAGIMVNGVQHGLLGSLAPPAQVTGVLNGASSAAGSIAPGEVLALTGIAVGPRPAVSASSTVGTTLGGTTVTINGTAVPILYTQADQTNVLVPWAITGTSANIVVTSGTAIATTTVPIAATAPGIFTANDGGSGASLTLNQDGTLNSASNAAAAGSVVVLYVTGLGLTDPPGQDGVVNSETVIAETVMPVAVTIGGQTAQVVYAGAAPGQLSCVMQVEAVVPTGAGTGPVPVVVTVGGVNSQAAVTVSLK